MQRLRASTLSGSCIDVNGRYQYSDTAESILGFGAYGTVYLGKDRKTSEYVAIKKIETEKVKKDEMDILKKLNSKHIVGLKDFHVQDAIGFDSRFTYVVMELCDSDLAAHLKIVGRLEIEDFNIVASGIVLGYAELYKCNIVHRDLKPGNILICYKWLHEESGVGPILSAKLTDFGISRLAGRNGDSKFKNVAGTPLYMAPEIGANILDLYEYDAQCDVWSIGVMFYECLSGQVPFDESALCKLFLHCASGNSEAYSPPTLPLKPKLPEQYQKLINDLLQIEASKRLRPLELLSQVLTLAKNEPLSRSRPPMPPMRTISTVEMPKVASKLRSTVTGSLAVCQRDKSL